MKKFYIPALLTVALAVSSCSRSDSNLSDSNNTATATPDKINDFVWKAMNSWYYWQPNQSNLADNLPNNKSAYLALINGKTPDQLFYNSLLYQYGTTDRFSWIENNNEIIEAGKTTELKKDTGLDFTLYQKDNTATARVALINYVVPGSAAAIAGLKRGDVITKVNGANLTSSNYTQLFNSSFTVTIAATVQDTSSAIVTTDGKTVTITETSIDANPVAYYKLFESGTKKIGYLVYNGFESDYNDELNAAFAKMKADGVNELILDLRYNGGGSVETSEALASMITGQFTGQNYIYFDFNNKHNDEDGYDKLKDNIQYYTMVNSEPTKSGDPVPINSLGLSKVYVLQSIGTASASELLINSLRKFIPVTTVGYESVGKFVGSITLYDSPSDDWTSYDNRNKTHNWKLQPIVFAYYNKDRDANPTGGLIPNYEVNPYDYFNTIKEFGDLSDPALQKAMSLITGSGKYSAPSFGYKPSGSNTMLAKSAVNSRLYIEDFAKFRK